MQISIDDLKINSLQSLLKPEQLTQQLPLTLAAAKIIQHARDTAAKIIAGKDNRLLVIVGPCSIHDVNAALEYATRLKNAATDFAAELFIMMRVYFEKPRTVLGWKGLINDPHLDNSFDVNYGLTVARKLLLDLTDLGIPAGTEFLDSIIPQYLGDLICWSAIGARTSQSPLHRELASGLSMPVGFKNSTDGNVKIAAEAVTVARYPHHFLSISKQGEPVIVHTQGNKNCHIILRGSNSEANYSAQQIQKAARILHNENLPKRLMIDCSHGNSGKNHLRQKMVIESLAEQISRGNKEIFGVMLESHLVAGKQILAAGSPLVYGQSITDACISWDETIPLLKKLALAVNKRNSLASLVNTLCEEL